jgi:predicted nucleic acid-binding protein
LTLLFDQLPTGPIVLDASAIINLLGCGDMQGVLVALGAAAVVEERTLKEVRHHPVTGLELEPVLDALRRAGMLQVARMTDLEYETYLTLIQGSLAQRLDDGESAAIALTARGMPVVLDENKARGLVRRKLPAVRYGSTLIVMFAAATRAGWPIERVQQLVIKARRHARMGVPRDERELLARLMDGVAGWPVA